MNDSQTEAEPLPPAPIVLTADDVESLLSTSDVYHVKLEREGGKWHCVARSLRAAGGVKAPTILQAIHGAVVKHNEEWEKAVGG